MMRLGINRRWVLPASVGVALLTLSSHAVAVDAAGVILLLVAVAGAGADLRAHHRRLVELAVVEERRRMARELHDGLAQELAFIVGRTRVLQRRPADTESLALLGSAADRALDASRAAIHELRAAPADELSGRLAGHAREIAQRAGLEFETGALEPIGVPAEHERAVIAVVREAATNAVRHARASQLRLEVVRRGGGVRVVVADDGRGLPAGDQDGPGFGRISMADRAEGLGGHVAFVSAPGAGTRVELHLPGPDLPQPALPRTTRRVAVRPARSAA